MLQLVAMRAGSPWCLAALSLTGCGGGALCSSEILQVARDLGSDRYAVTELRSCGATAGFATVVRVGRASEPQAAATEVFVADSDHGTATDDRRGAIWMSVVWPKPGKLSIAHASKARIFKRESQAKGATITYRASDPLTLPPVP